MVRKNESGYVALMSVLIVGAAATAIALTLLTSGSDTQRAMLVEQQSKQAHSLAVACAQEALQQVHDNSGFTSTNTLLTLGQGSCTYTVVVTAPTIRSILTKATVGNVVRSVQVYATLSTSNISITSWQDVI
jgi:hypothetical protein